MPGFKIPLGVCENLPIKKRESRGRLSTCLSLHKEREREREREIRIGFINFKIYKFFA